MKNFQYYMLKVIYIYIYTDITNILNCLSTNVTQFAVEIVIVKCRLKSSSR